MAGPGGVEHPAVLDFDHDHDYTSSLKHALQHIMPGALSPSEKTARSSFSSVRENDDGVAQTFTRSKVSSYITAADEAIYDESPQAEFPQFSFQAPLTQPASHLHGFLVPANSFKGWKEIPLKGRKQSRSVEDLRKLHMEWSPPQTPAPEKALAKVVTPGESRLEKLPTEILGKEFFSLFSPS
jgi:hypothetical protein